LQLPERPPVVTATDPLAEEQDYHERFLESRLRVYVGREQINDALLAFADGNDLVPCLVTGPSGSGKSAALARFVRDYQHKQPQTLVIPHFIGGSPRSTNLRDMLRRFCQVFKARFGFAEDVPEEATKLSVTFREFVGKVPTDTRVLLVIDALNQLDEADRAQELYWLPTGLPPQVKVIVSCITDSRKTEPVLKAFRWREHCPVQLAALSDAEQREIIRQVPSLSAKTLDDDQVRLLLSNPATANPLFLLVALEELRGFAPYERLNERIATFPREGDTATAIFTQVIERLAEEFNEKLVETVLTLLASARHGLSERELQELVAGLDGADDLFPVLRQLRPYLFSRAGLIDFYHRNLFKAVRERCLDTKEKQRYGHAQLADFFHCRWCLPDAHALSELPYHLFHSNNVGKLKETLLDFVFLDAKVGALGPYTLIDDFDLALPAEQQVIAKPSSVSALAITRRALQMSAHVLVLDASQLAGQLIGRLLDERRFPEVPALLLQASRAQKGLWLRPLSACLSPPDAPYRTALAGHSWTVLSVAVTPDGRRVVSGAVDKTVRVWDLERGEELLVLAGHTGSVLAAAITPDSRKVISGSEDGTLRVWDLESGELRGTLRQSETERAISGKAHAGGILAVAVTPDGRRVVSASKDWTLKVWDLETGEMLHTLRGHQGWIEAVAVTSDGRRAVSASLDRTLRVWDLERGLELDRLYGPSDEFQALAVTPDGHQVISGAKNGRVAVWNLANRLNRYSFLGHPSGSVLSLAVTPDGRYAISGSLDKTLKAWDLQNLQFAGQVDHLDAAYSVAVTPDGQRVVSGSRDGTLKVWALPLPQEAPKPDQGDIYSLAVTPDGRSFVAAFRSGMLQVWNMESQRVRQSFGKDIGRSSVKAVAVLPDGHRVVSGSEDTTLVVWDLESGQPLQTLGRTSLASPPPEVLASRERHFRRTYAATVAIIGLCYLALRALRLGAQVDSWGLLPMDFVVAGLGVIGLTLAWVASVFRRPPEGHKDRVQAVAVTPDGTRVVSASEDGTSKVWDLHNGRVLRTLVGHREPVVAVAVTPDGKRAVSASKDRTLIVWDLASGRQMHCLMGHLDSVRAVAILPDGRRAVSGSVDRTLKVWDLHSAQELMTLSGHLGVVFAVALTPDGRRAISVSVDRTLKVWNLENGVAIASFTVESPLLCCAFSPDGQTIVAGDHSGQALFFSLDG